MKNTINYYYNLQLNNIIKSNRDYYFYLNNEEYHLIKYTRPIKDIEYLYNLNMQMINRKVVVHQIILNKDKNPITTINNKPYILLKICNYKNNKVYLSDINYIQKMTYNLNFDNELKRDNWVKLWSDKIDYYEYQINQLGKEYPILCDSLSYYIGLGENAISYLINNFKDNKKIFTVSHKRIDITEGSFEFYNPLNFIIDNRVRDISEYIKNSFFKNELNFEELIDYLKYNDFYYDEYILLFSRLMFPTYYFDVYDQIINEKQDENIIIPIINQVDKYEDFLLNIYKFIRYEKKVQIEPIEWLLKDNY